MSRSLRSLVPLVLLGVVGCAPSADGDADSSEGAMSAQPKLSLQVLRSYSQAQLASLYDNGSVTGGIPVGDSRGAAISDSSLFNWFANAFWSGKHFFRTGAGQSERTTLKNHISLVGETADAVVTIIKDPRDQKDTIFLDYKDSGMFAVRGIKDFMRRVNENVYLGRAYEGKDFVCFFALDFNTYEDGLAYRPSDSKDPDKYDQFAHPVTFVGRAFCGSNDKDGKREDCSLSSIEDKANKTPEQRAVLDETFYEFNTGTFDKSGKAERSIVVLINPTKHKPAQRQRFHIFDAKKFDALVAAAANGAAIRLSGTQLGPNQEEGKLDSTPYDVGRLSMPEVTRTDR